MTISNITRVNINLLDPNLSIGQIATPSLQKNVFDEIYNYLDAIVAILSSVAPLISGADNLGSAPITGVTGTTIHDQINSIYGLYQSIASGIVPNYLIPVDTAFKFASSITETLSNSTGSLDFKEI